jgi:hypothetical protein
MFFGMPEAIAWPAGRLLRRQEQAARNDTSIFIHSWHQKMAHT